MYIYTYYMYIFLYSVSIFSKCFMFLAPGGQTQDPELLYSCQGFWQSLARSNWFKGITLCMATGLSMVRSKGRPRCS